MHHLKTERPFADLAKTSDADARLKLRLLLSRKVEKAQGRLTATIGNSHQQITATAIDGFGKLYLARNEAALTKLQGAELYELRPVLIAKWQQEPSSG